MSRGTGSTARICAVLVTTAFAVAVLLTPSLLLTTSAESVPLTLTLMTLALAALARLELRSVALAGADADGATRPTGDGATPVMTGRATDPVHHPLRPRAPGMA